MKRFIACSLSALLLALVLAGCDTPVGPDLTVEEPLVEKYTTVKETKTYELTITQSAANAKAKTAARAAFSPAEGDTYVLIISENGVNQTSNGIVMAYSNDKFTLMASINVSVSFEVTISGSGIINITGTITVQGGATVTGPGSLTTTTRFVAVTNITGIPSGAIVGNPITLSGTVKPSNATNKTIVWSLKDAGTTGAAINGNTLSTTAVGTITVTATIANGSTASTPYTQDFSIAITGRSGSAVRTVNSIVELSALLASLPSNTLQNPYLIALNTSDITGICRVLISEPNKYVSLDLSGSTITTIPDYTFRNDIPPYEEECSTLISITIPNSVTGIEYLAFWGCTSLTSITFQGRIPSSGFAINAFLGDLHNKFYATDKTNGTPGTYKTTAPVSSSSVWTKQ